MKWWRRGLGVGCPHFYYRGLHIWKEGVKAQILGKCKHGFMQLDGENATKRDLVTTGES